jgi:hypothetical protein
LIDYEKVTDERGRRLIFFGWHAGVVAMIDSLWALGQRLAWEGIANPFTGIRDTYTYDNLEAARADVRAAGERIKAEGLPAAITPLISGVSGYGNVGRGIQEILTDLPTVEVQPGDLARVAGDPKSSRNVVYRVTFKEEHSVEPAAAGAQFDLHEYYQHPEWYQACFEQYLPFDGVDEQQLGRADIPDGDEEHIRKLYSGLTAALADDRRRNATSRRDRVHGQTQSRTSVYVYDPNTGAATMGWPGAGSDVGGGYFARRHRGFSILAIFWGRSFRRLRADFSLEKLDIAGSAGGDLYHGK